MQQKKQQKQGKRREWKDQMKESDRMLKSNVLLEKPQWILGLTLAAEFLLLVVLHVLINTFIRFCKGHLADCFSWSCLTTFYPVLAPVYIFVVIVVDLCQYFEHKKLKGYADFFNSSSSFCCGVI